MKKTINANNILRYNRQVVLPQIDLDGQEALLNASVLLIGVGGLGCACAQYLVASGVGEITLVDDDVVDLSNLQRQVLHTEKDVGNPKVDSAYQALHAINSEAIIHRIDQKLDDHDMAKQISKHDLVVDCTDNLPTRNQLNKLCWELKTNLVSGAAIRMEGQLMVVQPELGGPCYACLSHLFGEQSLSCTEAGILSPVVGIIGAKQALLSIQLLSGIKSSLFGVLHLFDASSLQWQQITVPINPSCEVCQVDTVVQA